MMRKYCWVFFVYELLIAGCGFFCEELEICDGVKWRLLTEKTSCIRVEFSDEKISGDLHIEFLGDGVLVSKWKESEGKLEYSYIDLRKSKITAIVGDDFPMVLKQMRKEKDVFTSYSLFTLVGRNKIDSEYDRFDAERRRLKTRLSLLRNRTTGGSCSSTLGA